MWLQDEGAPVFFLLESIYIRLFHVDEYLYLFKYFTLKMSGLHKYFFAKILNNKNNYCYRKGVKCAK